MRITSDANEAIVRSGLVEGKNQRRSEIFDELLDPNYVNHNLPAPIPGPKGFRQVTGMFSSAFPDFYVTLHDVSGPRSMQGAGSHWSKYQSFLPHTAPFVLASCRHEERRMPPTVFGDPAETHVLHPMLEIPLPAPPSAIRE